MTRLFHDLMPQQGGGANEFIQQASKQGFGMNVADFMRFAKMAEGKDMNAIVQELRQSGAISDAQFNDLKQKATGFMSLIKMVTGK